MDFEQENGELNEEEIYEVLARQNKILEDLKPRIDKVREQEEQLENDKKDFEKEKKAEWDKLNDRKKDLDEQEKQLDDKERSLKNLDNDKKEFEKKIKAEWDELEKEKYDFNQKEMDLNNRENNINTTVRNEAEKLARKLVRQEEWKQKYWKIPLPTRVWGIVFLSIFLGVIGYFCYWGVKLHIADFKSKTEYCKVAPNSYEKNFAEDDGFLHYRASYIKALVNAQFIDPKEIESWERIPEELKELSNAVRAVAWDMQDKYYDKLLPIDRLELYLDPSTPKPQKRKKK